MKILTCIIESFNFFENLLESGIIKITISIISFILIYIYRNWLKYFFFKLFNWIRKLWFKNIFERYRINDLIFEYFPIFNDWKESIKILNQNDVTVSKVINNEFPLDTELFPGKNMKNDDPNNHTRFRLDNYRITKDGKLKVTFRKTHYADYLNSNEYLDRLYLKQNRTYREVLLKQIERGNIEDYPLSNICGAGIFSITTDNYLIASKHSRNSKVYPNIYTYTASGVLNYLENSSNANPFNGMLEIYSSKIGYDIKENYLKMIGFGADARKLYFQFSFYEKSKLDYEELKTFHDRKNSTLPIDQKRELIAIPNNIDDIIGFLFDKIWEPAAEVTLLTFCADKYGKDSVLRSLKKYEDHWQERNTRNEFEYRCSSRKGYLIDLTTSIPINKLNEISNKNIKEIFSFVGRENLDGKKILEIGCGTGRITKKLLDYKPKEIYCIDVSPCMIEKHKKVKETNDTKIFRKNKYFQFWEPRNDNIENIQIAICSLVLIHNKNYQQIIEKLCSMISEKIFIIEDVTDPIIRKRKTSPYTFLLKKEIIINEFKKYGWKTERSYDTMLYVDNIALIEFKLS